MTGFHKFPKVRRLGDRETRGLLDGDVVVTIKMDGANASLWTDEEGIVQRGSRNRHLPEEEEGFNGFAEWLNLNQDRVETTLRTLSIYFGREVRAYGEWMTPHQLKYPDEVWKNFLFFDVVDAETGDPLMYRSPDSFSTCLRVIREEGLKHAGVIGSYNKLSLEEIREILSGLEGHEGVVVTGLGEVTSESRRGKVVTKEFLEDKGSRTKPRKGSEGQFEQHFADRFVTPSRVKKAMHRTVELKGEDQWDRKLIGPAMNILFEDIIDEESGTIAREMLKSRSGFDFHQFKTLVSEHARPILIVSEDVD